jgi:hypothetical protein
MNSCTIGIPNINKNKLAERMILIVCINFLNSHFLKNLCQQLKSNTGNLETMPKLNI